MKLNKRFLSTICLLGCFNIFSLKAAVKKQVVAKEKPIEKPVIEQAIDEETVKKAVVKVNVFINNYDYKTPWKSPSQHQGHGSGFVLEGQKIITNAHVVGESVFTQLQKVGEAKKYTAKILAVNNESDLALLKVEDPKFFENLTPLKLGGMPKTEEEIKVYGFPIGGTELSVTKGIVSRAVFVKAVHSQKKVLSSQVDAAINPGNSGGPAIDKNGKVVGVAFQGMLWQEGIGYIISPIVVSKFLEAVEKGSIPDNPTLGIRCEKFENQFLRENFKVTDDITGVIVNGISTFSPCAGQLENGDILIAIDGVSVANDGTIEFRVNERLPLNYLIAKKFLGDFVELTVYRNNEKLVKKIQLNKKEDDLKIILPFGYNADPTYYIFGGLVFQPLNRDLLGSIGWSYNEEDNEWNNYKGSILDYYSNFLEKSKERESLVILTSVLSNEINVGYQHISCEVVSEVNGKKILNINDFINVIETTYEKYIDIVTDSGKRIVLDKEKAQSSAKDLLNTYGIREDRSKNLIK